MKRMTAVLVSLVLIAVVVFLASVALRGNAFAQPPSNEVVILRCAVSAPVSSIPSVMSASGSTGAPIVQRGTICAQAVSDLLKEGFALQDVESAGRDADTDLYYTLMSGN